jgi:broad specificity phosphatase PhoE
MNEEQTHMRAIFIRHGQSTGNAGIPCNDLSLLELTELGWRQSWEVAANWTETPDLIVTSPYLRTRQTAAATIERFSNCARRDMADPGVHLSTAQPMEWNP